MLTFIAFVIYLWFAGFIISSLATVWKMGAMAVFYSLNWPKFWVRIIAEIEEPLPGESILFTVMVPGVLLCIAVVIATLLVYFGPIAL